MRGEHLRRRVGTGASGAPFAGARTFVVRRTALGLRGFVHHAYGRVTRLAAGAGAGKSASREELARAIGREALHRDPTAVESAAIAALLAGPGPRWELAEDEVRGTAGRAAAATTWQAAAARPSATPAPLRRR